jgi:polyisoprenoid-binding protein YceI
MKRPFVIAAFVTLASGGAAGAQTPVRWVVEPRSSLAWWQIDPHYNHLWATTCPDDPSWQPGEGRSPGYYIDYLRRPDTKDNDESDPRVPLYPRRHVRALCRAAVTGVITLSDPTAYNSARGTITIMTDSLVTGLNLRDAFARKQVFQTYTYPHLRFTIDSLVNVQQGETIHATAVGTFEIHGTRHTVRAPAKITSEAGGLRVQAQFQERAKALTHEYGLPETALGMGVTIGRWRTVHMGVDLLLKRGQ